MKYKCLRSAIRVRKRRRPSRTGEELRWGRWMEERAAKRSEKTIFDGKYGYNDRQYFIWMLFTISLAYSMVVVRTLVRLSDGRWVDLFYWSYLGRNWWCNVFMFAFVWILKWSPCSRLPPLVLLPSFFSSWLQSWMRRWMEWSPVCTATPHSLTHRWAGGRRSTVEWAGVVSRLLFGGFFIHVFRDYYTTLSLMIRFGSEKYYTWLHIM